MRVLLIDAKPKLALALAAHSDVHVGLLPLQPVYPEIMDGGIPTWPYHWGRKLSPSAVWQVRRAIKEFQPDLVHPFFSRPLSHTLLAVAGWRRRPKVVSSRGITRDLSRLDPGNWISYLHPGVDAYGCVSEAVRESLVRSGIAPSR